VGTRYWEGAVTARGAEGGRPVSGAGYVELVGYGDGAALGEAGARPAR
jgi:hypothetical protein